MNAAIEYINAIGGSFVRFAWPMLIQSSVLIVILLLVDLLLRKRVRAVFRYWLWMLVLIKLVLPVSLSTPASLGTIAGDKLSLPAVSPRAFNPENQLSSTAAQPAPTETQPLILVPEDSRVSPKPMFAAATPVPILTWQAVVFLIWLVVVAAMLLLLAQRVTFVYGLIRQSQKANSLLTEALEFCRKQIGLRQQVSLKVSPNATSPAVCGLFRPVILVPNDLAPSLGSSHLRHVLMHELAHIKRGDLWINLAQTLLQIIYFYNPLLWLSNAVIRRVREQAVDETVQVALAEKATQYPETLLNVAKLAFARPALSLRLVGVVESKTALKQRIKKMIEMPIPRTAKLGIVGLLAIFVIGVVLLPMAGAQKTKGGQYKTRTSSSNTPTVVKTIPEAFKNDVSPNLRKIKVMFDQPMMDKSWSWVRWNYPYPESTGEPYYNSTKNTCTLPVILESGKAYFVRINSEPYMNFKSEKGISAQPYVLVFATKDENGNPTVIPQEMLDKAKQINTVNPIPYTQELVAQIRPDGTIDFVTTVRSINESDSVITTTNFINSDFVNVTSMSDGKDRPIKFTTTHDGDHYSYHLVFNEAVKPKELMVYSHKGTMSGLVKPVNGLENTYRYYMKHWPSTGRPTRRIETFILPKGAKLISTTPSDMGRNMQNSRIELHVDEIIPEGKSITTAFEYSLATDEYHEEIELAWDDGKNAGKWSFSGGGHGVKLTAPSEDCVLKAIKLYGSRYGEYDAPDEDFDVWVCDKDFNVIKNFRFPYSLFKKRGYTDWVTMETDAVEVPKEFAICVAFDPHQTKGIYVYHDARTSRRSYQGIPPQMEPFKDGDWMIRAVIEQPAEAGFDNNGVSDAEDAKRIADEKPRIISINPPPGSEMPLICELEIVFDRPMDPNEFEITGPANQKDYSRDFGIFHDYVEYDASQNKFVMPFRLPANWNGSVTFQKFVSVNGAEAEPVTANYHTLQTPFSEALLRRFRRSLDSNELIAVLQEVKDASMCLNSVSETVNTTWWYGKDHERSSEAVFKFQGDRQFYADISGIMDIPFYVASDGNNCWFYLDGTAGKQLKVVAYDDVNEMNIEICNPFSIKDTEILEAARQYNLQYERTELLDDRTCYLIRSWRARTYNLRTKCSISTWWIDTETFMPVQIFFDYAGGGTTLIRFTYQSINEPMGPDAFAYHALTNLEPNLPEPLDEGYDTKFINCIDGSVAGRMSVKWGMKGPKGTVSSGLN